MVCFRLSSIENFAIKEQFLSVETIFLVFKKINKTIISFKGITVKEYYLQLKPIQN